MIHQKIGHKKRSCRRPDLPNANSFFLMKTVFSITALVYRFANKMGIRLMNPTNSPNQATTDDFHSNGEDEDGFVAEAGNNSGNNH